MACKQGIRKNIDAAKIRYAKQKEYDPYRELWTSLVRRFYENDSGLSGLTEHEGYYFSVGILDGEIYNGGFDQFFYNSSGDLYDAAERGLAFLEANCSLRLLRQARDILFSTTPYIFETGPRRAYLLTRNGRDAKGKDKINQALDAIDKEYYKDTDKLQTRLKTLAIDQHLIDPYKK